MASLPERRVYQQAHHLISSGVVFRRVLIANRGEIALRIARACKTLGIETVCVHSEADRDGPWLDAMDERVCIGPARAELSYLDQDSILEAAEQRGCSAIHPGYGFLAENARFAARSEQHGLTFIGPGPSAIRTMGDKATAKDTLAAAGLPTIPGSDGIVDGVEQAAAVAGAVGYPVLLKAAAGGGGKGMRRADDRGGLARAFAESAREAEAAFGDGRLYLEKLIERARHVEFQVLCDGFGHGIHLGERECSVQRHHQKLIEEAPSPAVDAATRDRFGRRVADAVTAVGYRNAGTVEFLLAPDGAFYFMEMNTRLQVEHPVTELLTGVDIVVEQIRIAANEPLSRSQDDVAIRGHAIELRSNAEDPDAGFRPDPGRIERFVAPADAGSGIRVRWDSAVREGYRIPPHYDSLIGKLIVHGPDRIAAIDGARRALDSLVVLGVRTTAPLHRALLADERFRSGTYDVELLARKN
jgi:acetyl-CoA carboxylase biotin carboxylase subunit